MTEAARQEILGRIRRALGRGELAPAQRSALEARLASPVANLIPGRARVGRREQLALFDAMAEELGATVRHVAGATGVPAAVARYLASENLPAEAAIAPDPALDALPWDSQPLLTLRRGKTAGDDLVGITGCFAGVAETGTLVMLSGPQAPTTLNFLPETHVVVIRQEAIVGTYEDVWARLRASGRGTPRTINLISGPSRTADIEQTIQRGAHGPRRLCILVVDGGG